MKSIDQMKLLLSLSQEERGIRKIKVNEIKIVFNVSQKFTLLTSSVHYVNLKYVSKKMKEKWSLRLVF